jgi:GntR family transcriptional regulator, transcriptional repressor for pyruvate dehydrogenase complex
MSVLERTIGHLEQKVLEGDWSASMRLPSERALAESIGVSRSTIREAIQRLVSKGVLETRPGSGVYVVQRQRPTLSAPWVQLLDGHPPMRTETLEFRLVFECAAARFAAQRSTEVELDHLAAILSRMREAVATKDVDVEARTDAEFHTALAAAAHNRMLEKFYASVITMLREHITTNTFDATLNNANAASQAAMRLAQHESIYFAVRERNPDAAQQAMLAHIDFVGRQFEPDFRH